MDQKIYSSLTNEYNKLYENKERYEEQLTIIHIHLLYLKLFRYNKIKNLFFIAQDLQYDIYETIKEIEDMSVQKEYVNEIIILYKKFNDLFRYTESKSFWES